MEHLNTKEKFKLRGPVRSLMSDYVTEIVTRGLWLCSPSEKGFQTVVALARTGEILMWFSRFEL